MGRIYPLNDSQYYASSLVYSPCASHFFPALSELEPTANFRESFNGLDMTPFGVYVNLRVTASSQQPVRQLLDGLIQEIHLRSNSRCKRAVHSLQLKLPLKPLESAETTELIYHLSRFFRLAHDGQHRFSAMLPVSQATDETLALLKGLGFNQLVLETLDKELSVSELRDSLGCASDYHFNDVTLQLTSLSDAHVDIISQLTSRDASPRLEHVEVDLPPQSWSEHAPEVAEERAAFERLFNLLRQEGYRVLGNDCFILPSHLLARGQNEGTLRRTPVGYNVDNIVDVCGLGPGSITRENNHFYRNVPSFQGYIQRLSEQHSPVSHAYSMSDQQKLLQLIIDQLVCFHALDLDYLSSRYQLDSVELVGTLQRHTQTMAANQPWFSASSGRLTLTPEGIFQLHHLVHIISQHAEHCCPE